MTHSERLTLVEHSWPRRAFVEFRARVSETSAVCIVQSLVARKSPNEPCVVVVVVGPAQSVRYE